MRLEGEVGADHARREDEGQLRAEAEARRHAPGGREDNAEEGVMPQNSDAVDRFDPLVLIGDGLWKLHRDPGEELAGVCVCMAERQVGKVM